MTSFTSIFYFLSLINLLQPPISHLDTDLIKCHLSNQAVNNICMQKWEGRIILLLIKCINAVIKWCLHPTTLHLHHKIWHCHTRLGHNFWHYFATVDIILILFYPRSNYGLVSNIKQKKSFYAVALKTCHLHLICCASWVY